MAVLELPRVVIKDSSDNIREDILAAQDRVMEITYEDFGLPTQRITLLKYTAASVPGFELLKIFTYTLVGVRYRRDLIYWSIVTV
jgi:hypothetical protein